MKNKILVIDKYKDVTINGSHIMVMSMGKGDANSLRMIETLLNCSKSTGKSEFLVDLSKVIKDNKIGNLNKMLNEMVNSCVLLTGRNFGVKPIFENFGLYDDSDVILVKTNNIVVESLDDVE